MSRASRSGFFARVASALLVATMLAGWSGAALAQEDIQKGRTLYKQGEMAFTTGDYEKAATLFQQAYEASRRPQLLWNLASAHRRWYDIDPNVAHLRKARAIYDNYASLIGTPKEVAEARQEIALIDAKLAALDKPAAATSVVAQSTVPKEAAPVDKTQAVDAAARKTTTAPSPVDKTPEAVVKSAAQPMAPAEAQSTPVYKKWWLWTIVGVAVVGAGVGAGVALGVPHNASTPTGLTLGTYKPMWP